MTREELKNSIRDAVNRWCEANVLCDTRAIALLAIYHVGKYLAQMDGSREVTPQLMANLAFEIADEMGFRIKKPT